MHWLRRRWYWLLLGLVAAGFLIYQIPWVNERVDWRVQLMTTNLRYALNPPGELPAPEVVNSESAPTALPAPTLAAPTPTAQFTPTPLAASVQLPPPAWEQQGPNNCGPATLTMYLRYYGWGGDQDDIAEEIKPVSADRNVNVDELIYYTRNWTGWLQSIFRVGGDEQLLKRLLANGFPVMIEEGEVILNQGPNDDNWAAHYILLTGYDEATGQFTYQDSFRGPDQQKSYAEIDEFWQQFNRVYILLYPPDQEETVKAILGADWDEDANRQNALVTSQVETQADPHNPYAWFNVGMNQVYFEQYGAANEAFDEARRIGLPMRMLRYQFGPFVADYNTNRMEDMQEIIDYALAVTPNSEDVLLWKGWMFYKQGDINAAMQQFQLAQEANPQSFYVDQALNFLGTGQ